MLYILHLSGSTIEHCKIRDTFFITSPPPILGVLQKWKIVYWLFLNNDVKVESCVKCRKNTLCFQTHQKWGTIYWKPVRVYSGLWFHHRHLREIDCSLAVVGRPAAECGGKSIHLPTYSAKKCFIAAAPAGGITTIVNKGRQVRPMKSTSLWCLSVPPLKWRQLFSKIF